MNSVKYPEKQNQTYSPELSPKKLSALKILAIDDEEIMGYLIQRIIKHLGHSVDWVTNFELALQKINQEDYDVILSDYKMPSMSGDMFYKKIIKLEKSLEDRLIFITGDTVNQKTQRFLKSIKVPYLSKPFNIDELNNTIQNVASKSVATEQ